MQYTLNECPDNADMKEVHLEKEIILEGTRVLFRFNKPRLCEIQFRRQDESMFWFSITFLYHVPSEPTELPYWAFFGSSGYENLAEAVDSLCDAARAKLVELAVRFEKELLVVARTNEYLKKRYLLWGYQENVLRLTLELANLQAQGPILGLE